MKVLIFLGSVRQSTPPNPSRLGERVALACKRIIQTQSNLCDVEIIDPLEVDLDPIFKPHFSFAEKDAPEHLRALATKIKHADAYVMISPEYNHSMSPALANLLNHFGASLYAYKPSAIVTYSAGQWGGARAAVNMRTFLSELGCLPVSAMIHLPKAQEVFNEYGDFLDNVERPDRWNTYLGRTFKQLYWWAEASKNQRAHIDPHELTENFKQNPSQRNAPS